MNSIITTDTKGVHLKDWQAKFPYLTAKCDHLLNSQEWCDAVFSVGEEPNVAILKAHKLILSISSPVFGAMFYGDLASKEECIQIIDIEPPTFKLLLRYAYTDAVFLKNVDEACKLYYAAKKYVFPSLMEICINYLMKSMQPDKVLVIYEFAKFYDERMLSEAAMLYSAKNATKVLEEDSFNYISADTVVTLFQREDLNIDMEIKLLDAILRNKNVLNSAHHKEKVLQQIRFFTLTPLQFIECQGIDTILNGEERFTLLAKLISPKCQLPMPLKFEMSLEARKKQLDTSTTNDPCEKQFIRECIIYRPIVINGHGYFSKFSTSLQLESFLKFKIIGIDVVTQVYFECMQYDDRKEYKEDLKVTVTDDSGVIVGAISFHSSVHFNCTTRVNFKTPISLKCHKKYQIIVNFEKDGFYPLASGYSECEKDTTKYIISEPQIDDDDDESVPNGFIRAIIFEYT